MRRTRAETPRILQAASLRLFWRMLLQTCVAQSMAGAHRRLANESIHRFPDFLPSRRGMGIFCN